MKTYLSSAVSKIALACLVIVLSILTTACEGDVVNLPPSTSVSTAASPQPSLSISSVESPSVLTRAMIRELILEQVTFEEMEESYELEIEDVGLVGGFSAHIPTMPDVSWGFVSRDDKPDVFYLNGVDGPASFILPEYVGMRLDEIPIVLMIYGEDVGGSGVDMLDDDGWEYSVLLLSTPGILAVDDNVSMSANINRQ